MVNTELKQIKVRKLQDQNVKDEYVERLKDSLGEIRVNHRVQRKDSLKYKLKDAECKYKVAKTRAKGKKERKYKHAMIGDSRIFFRYDLLSEILRGDGDIVASLLYQLFKNAGKSHRVSNDLCKAVILPLYKGKSSRQPSYKGKYLLDHVCQQLNLTETDYFGLRYVDAGGQRHWLHMGKSILKQVKDASPILFSFRVKFYPPNPLLLKEDVTRFQIYLQLKRDLLHGRLYCTSNEAAMLGALIIQVELGDYDPSIHVGGYVSEMRLLLRQTETIEGRIQDLHREPVEGSPGSGGGVKGLSTQEAERMFLKIACQLDTYGVDPHPVKIPVLFSMPVCIILDFKYSFDLSRFHCQLISSYSDPGPVLDASLYHSQFQTQF
ncbi:FERM domain-containing protein 5 [Eumeta japonica]|uniref:Moesin/ezrin/radixin homolog 1 n=1 Tax=Eumeta variegata TaxID=151549 RepID=A0A4C1SAM5_EUMVA|nr:FERM domain-containing protein 5 [Eumeta japonica]